MDVEDRRKLLLILGIVFSFLLIVVAATIATARTSYYGKASSRGAGDTLLSLENSYLFASPLSAEANGTSVIRVTAFIMNNQGLGVTGQKVALKSGGTVKIISVQEVTDNFGRAIFDLTGSIPGNYTISAEVGGASLPQTVQASFQ